MLKTVTLVLERAGQPLPVPAIHAAAEQLAGQSLRSSSVKTALAAEAASHGSRVRRIRRGIYV